jgi:acyl-CoA synthetase (AMP-forming)/AMP-acid ligase II
MLQPIYYVWLMLKETGATLLLPAESFDAKATISAMEENKVTALYGVPTMFLAQLERNLFELVACLQGCYTTAS